MSEKSKEQIAAESDEAWRGDSRRKAALDHATKLHGQSASSDKIVETAQVFLDFLTGAAK